MQSGKAADTVDPLQEIFSRHETSHSAVLPQVKRTGGEFGVNVEDCFSTFVRKRRESSSLNLFVKILDHPSHLV